MCRPSSDMKRTLIGLVVALLPVLTASCLNPDFVGQTFGGLYPSAPWDEPFLLVRVVNDTLATLDVPIWYDDGTGPQPFLFRDITPQAREAGVLLDWPVAQVNVGSLDTPFATTIVASLPDGTNVLVAPNQFPAQAGVDFNRGDALIYRFTAANTNPAAITVSIARIDGSTQQGPFSRADTFRTVRQLLQVGDIGTGLSIGSSSSLGGGTNTGGTSGTEGTGGTGGTGAAGGSGT